MSKMGERFRAWWRRWSDDTAYRQNIDVIRESNLKFYQLYDSMMIGLLAALFASTLFSDYARGLEIVYLVFMACSMVELLYIRIVRQPTKQLLRFSTPFGIFKSYLFCLLSSVVFNRDAPAITYYIFLILIPVSFLLRPRTMLWIQTAALVSFCAVTALCKDPALVMGDSMSCVLFFIISIVIGGQISRLRMENLSLAAISHRRSLDLENQRDLLTMALKITGLCAWQYDGDTRTLTPTYTPAELGAFDRVVKDMPETMIRDGLVQEDSVPGLRALFAGAEAGETTLQGDFLMRGRSEEPFRWMQITMIPQSNPDGSARQFMGTSEDVTERKLTELAYAEQLRIMDSANETNLIAKGRWNLTLNRLEYMQQHSERALPMHIGDTFDRNAENLVNTVFPEEKRSEVRQALDREALAIAYRAGTDAYTVTFQRLTEQHQAIWVRLLLRVCRAPNGEDLFCFFFTYDITEEMLNRGIIDRLMAVEYDLLGTIDVKTGYCRVHTMRGKNAAPASAEDAPPVAYANFAAAAVHRDVVPEERPQVAMATSLSTVLSRLGEHDTYLLPFSTVENGAPARKKLEYCYLDDARETILYYRSDITAMYHREQEQLRQTEAALETAKQASAAKTEFFSRMSHDMRTPMNGILGLARLSADETDPAVLRQNISRIRTSGQYLLGLINDTLDFQKIESGRMALYPELVATRELVRSVTGLVADTASQKGVTLRLLAEDADLDGFVRVDPMRIRQVYVNLLSNAIKFTPANGTVEVRIEARGISGRMTHTVVTVTDTGIGMSADFLRNGIFKPFSQEPNALSDTSGGTGLGLSIVKKLVELMQGTIAVTSEPGVGSTFTVTMDLERADSTQMAQSADHAQRRREKVNELIRGKRVLLAEDHPLNAEIATKLLQKVGVTAVWVKDGLACVDAFAQSQPGTYDAILMDIRMPLMDGLEAAARIRALPHPDAAKIPMIAMTANAYDDDVRRSLAAGMNDHLAKPVDPVALYDTLAERMGA